MDNNKFKPVSRPSYGGQNNSFNNQSSYQRNSGFQMPPQGNNNDENPFQNNNFQETSNPINTPRTPRNKKNNKKPLLIGIGVAVAAVVIGALFFVNSSNKPNINVDLTDPATQVDSSVFGDTTNVSVPGVDGNPVQVKWPSDITPTKMELHLDPVTGSPILMLVGDKTGLGTVVRAHDASGKLTGFWVIVTDEPALDNYTANTNTTADNPTQEQAQVQTPTLEQTIYNEIVAFIPTIGNKTKEDLLKEHKTQLTEVSKKYGKTNEECLDIFIQQYVALNNTNNNQ